MTDSNQQSRPYSIISGHTDRQDAVNFMWKLRALGHDVQFGQTRLMFPPPRTKKPWVVFRGRSL